MSPREEYDRIYAEFERLGDELREFWMRTERSTEELRAFNRYYLPRHDEIVKAMGLALRRLEEEAQATRLRDEETLAEFRAQREALFRIFDRLDGRDDEAA